MVNTHEGLKDEDQVDERPWVPDEYIQLLLSNEFHDAMSAVKLCAIVTVDYLTNHH